MIFKSSPRDKGAVKISIVSLAIYLLVIGGAYGCWKFLPLWWENNEIKNMLGEVAITARRASDTALRDKILYLMKSKFATEVSKEDIKVWRKGDYVYLNVRYQRLVKHPWGGTTLLTLSPQVKRLIL